MIVFRENFKENKTKNPKSKRELLTESFNCRQNISDNTDLFTSYRIASSPYSINSSKLLQQQEVDCSQFGFTWRGTGHFSFQFKDQTSIILNGDEPPSIWKSTEDTECFPFFGG